MTHSCVVLLVATLAACTEARTMSPRGSLIFADEFDTFDTNVWNHLITSWRGGQNQFQYYHNLPENSWAENGMLKIKPTLTADRFNESFLYNGILDLTNEGCNYGYEETGLNSSCYRKAGPEIINPIQSARIRTIDSFGFTYGILETRVKLSKGDWLWPSIWMGPTVNTYGTWPASGEIDITEIRGNDNFQCDGSEAGNRRSKSTLHWGPAVNQDKYEKTGWSLLLNNGSFADEFHTFTMEWLQTGIYYYIDGEYLGGVTPPSGGFWQLGNLSGPNIWANGSNPLMTPFDHDFHIIIKVAAGGDYFPDRCFNGGYEKPWSKANSTTPMKEFWEARNLWLPTWNRKPEDSTMMVDYIRVYSLQ